MLHQPKVCILSIKYPYFNESILGGACVSFFDNYDGEKHMEIHGKRNSIRDISDDKVNEGRLKNQIQKLQQSNKSPCRGFSKVQKQVC